MPLRRYLLTRPIHGFLAGDRFLVDEVDGAVTMVRQAAWTAEALRLAELNGCAAEILPEPSPSTHQAPAQPALPLPRRRASDQRQEA